MCVLGAAIREAIGALVWGDCDACKGAKMRQSLPKLLAILLRLKFLWKISTEPLTNKCSQLPSKFSSRASLASSCLPHKANVWFIRRSKGPAGDDDSRWFHLRANCGTHASRCIVYFHPLELSNFLHCADSHVPAWNTICKCQHCRSSQWQASSKACTLCKVSTKALSVNVNDLLHSRSILAYSGYWESHRRTKHMWCQRLFSSLRMTNAIGCCRCDRSTDHSWISTCRCTHPYLRVHV